MNIAHLLPATAQFPLKKHNGRYEWALRLAREQAKRGHVVTLYAAPDSYDDSPQLLWASIPDDPSSKILNNTALIKKAFQSEQHDIFHSHFDSLHYSLAHLTSKPIVCTQHWFPDITIATTAQAYPASNVHVVPVTRFMEQKDRVLGIKTERMIHHGIDLSLFKPHTGQISERFIFCGRVTPSKGVYEAVILAKEANISLDIVGKINETDEQYWERIAPFVDGEKIRYIGARPQEELAELLKNAKGFIFPSQKEEAFGQTIVEAQACGTPVIISDVGASYELVKDTVTGFVCPSKVDFINAVKNIGTINRVTCRQFAENFSDQKMYRNYEVLYVSLIR